MNKKSRKLLIALCFALIIAIGIFFFGKSLLYKRVETTDNSEENEKSSTENLASPDINDLLAVPLATDEVSLIAVGDLMLDRNVGNRMKELNDYHFPIKNTKDLLSSADISFGNLECPVCEGRQIGITELAFRADPRITETLLYGGFDVVSLANNHTMDFGQSCLRETFRHLNTANIDYIGAGENFESSHKPLIKNVNGLTIAFLAYNNSDVVPESYFAGTDSAGTNKMDIDQMKQDIAAIKSRESEKVNIIIVSMHSGTEYTPVPNSRQKSFAQTAIDAGADIILGHHPHAVQHIEQYKEKYIIYSMGNFVMDQMRWLDCTKELLLNISLSYNAVKEVEIIPIRMKNFVETNIAVGNEKTDILEIINFETEQQPYIIFENDTFVQKERDILIDLTENKNDNTTSSKNIRMEWSVEEEIFDVVQFDDKLYVVQNHKIIWNSEDEWDISDFGIYDFDNDGIAELGIAFWRIGDYGKQLEGLKVKRGDKLSSHLFLLEFTNGEVRSQWGGSTVDLPIIDFTVEDVDNDGENELIVLEGTYEDFDNNQLNGKTIGIWQWNDWGFSHEYRSSEMAIKDMWINRKMVYLNLKK